jgi:5'-nucleotidase / UDP-sugar diphosphatase
LGDLKKAIVDADRSAPGVQELKEWAALSTYMKTFPDSDGNGIPNIPLRYRQPEGRVLATPTWNPIALIRGGNYITYGFLVIGILILGAVFLLIRAVLRKLNCIYQR